jgi:taurine dioxygenase
MNQQTKPVNAASGIEVVKFDAPLGASISGIDFAKPVAEATRKILRDAWAEHLILLFRGQSHISQKHHIDATEIFGKSVPGAKLKYFKESGTELVHQARFPEISIVSNLGADGEPAMENEGLGSGEVVWHSDNSYVEEPPIGSFLRAQEIPPDGGDTSFNNQYLAYETLPADIKLRIKGLYTKQDSSRNSAGRLRPGVSKPEALADVPGPDHPLVRIHPVTGRKALYLGRRRDFPSQYIIGWGRKESEELLDFLWDHATGDCLKYTHVWEAGDMVLWDNRCVMHYRRPLTTLARRIMHRTLVEHQKPIPA